MTPDGPTITIAASLFIQGYSKDGTMAAWVHPEDFSVVQTPQGLRVYFILYGGSSRHHPRDGPLQRHQHVDQVTA